MSGGAAPGSSSPAWGATGADGLAMLRRARGYTAAQSAATSVVYGMPRVAIDSGAASHELDLDDIPVEILRARRVLAKRPGVISRSGTVVATKASLVDCPC